jgi:molecular chaperone DnaK (HSP70)
MKLVAVALVAAGLAAVLLALRHRSVASTPQPQFLSLEADSPAVAQDGVLAENIGISIYEGGFAPLLHRGDSHPAEASFTFSTTEDNQEQITLHFYRGHTEHAAQNTFLGDVRITGYPLARAQEPLVRVFIRAADGNISVGAINEHTGAPVRATRTLDSNAEALQ